MSGLDTLILFSDEHRRDVLGCAGLSLVQTPNVDALAARGTWFTNACSPSPICVSARAALATGLHVNQNCRW